jgi:hypothetical protein
MRLNVLALLAVIGVSRSFAGLAWEQTQLQLEAEPLREKIEAVFRFTNTGDKTVTISDTHASCGCTVPVLEKREYAPGEHGEIRVVYTYGEVTGPQQKTLTVLTAEPDAQTHVLTLDVNIPALWEVQPKFVKWERGEEPAAKSVRIHALRPDIAVPVAVSARDDRFAVDLRPVADAPGFFDVTIKPGQTDAAIFTSVLVATNAPGEKPREIQLYALVR